MADIPALIAEGRRLIAEYARAKEDGLDFTANTLWDEGCAFWDANGAALLDVAEAAARDMEEHAALGRGVDPALDSALSKLRGVRS